MGTHVSLKVGCVQSRFLPIHATLGECAHQPMRARNLQKLGLRPDDVDDVLGSRKLREEMVDAGWLRPVVQRHKLTLYDSGEVTRAWARILAGETPRPRARLSKAKTQSPVTNEAPGLEKFSK